MDFLKKSRALPYGKEVDNNELYLIYIHKVGETSSGYFEYEFIFSVSPDTAIGEKWEELDFFMEESSNRTPKNEFIDKIGTLKTKIDLETVYEDGNFRMLDAVYGVIALAWEIIDDFTITDTLPSDILVFHYKDSLEKVENKLFSKDLKLRFD